MIQPTKTAATRVSANTRTSTTTKSRDSMVEFLQRSTIYKRHQARLVKNMEKPHDPRSKAVRVLAGLPGFRTLMLPPSEASQEAQQQQQPIATMKDETIFQTQPQSSSSSTTSSASSTASSSTTQPQATVPIHLILTAGVAGAVAEVCYGSTTSTCTKKGAGMQSPFQNAQMMAARQQQAERRAALPFVNEHGSLSIFRFHSAMAGHSPLAPSSSSFLRGTAAGKAQVVAGASSACFLFGTKALVSSLLAEQQQQDNNSNNNAQKQHLFSATSLVSSAMAGAMVAGVSTLQSTPINFLKVPTPSLFMTTLPRHVLGATLYFSSYEAFQRFFVSSKNSTTGDHNDKNHSSISAVAISGGAAGALYQMALLQGTWSTRTPRMVTTTPPRLLPTIVRAAPAHALLFVAYEWAQGNL